LQGQEFHGSHAVVGALPARLAFRAFSTIRFSGIIIHSILGNPLDGGDDQKWPVPNRSIDGHIAGLVPGAGVLSAGDTQRGLP
jgi:hypothetical protein